jgi:hypothetical protein
MKKTVIEILVGVLCLILAILFFILFSTEESKVILQKLDVWTLIKTTAKPVLGLTFALGIISAFIRALFVMLKKGKKA